MSNDPSSVTSPTSPATPYPAPAVTPQPAGSTPAPSPPLWSGSPPWKKCDQDERAREAERERWRIRFTTSLTPDFGSRRRYRICLNRWKPKYCIPGAGPVLSPQRLLARLDGRAWEPSDPESAAAELCRRINERAAQLALPSVAAISEKPRRSDPKATSLLDVLTVLAKTVGDVYLRDREPWLSGLQDHREVVIIIPPHWRPT